MQSLHLWEKFLKKKIICYFKKYHYIYCMTLVYNRWSLYLQTSILHWNFGWESAPKQAKNPLRELTEKILWRKSLFQWVTESLSGHKRILLVRYVGEFIFLISSLQAQFATMFLKAFLNWEVS